MVEWITGRLGEPQTAHKKPKLTCKTPDGSADSLPVSHYLSVKFTNTDYVSDRQCESILSVSRRP